jgi:hypothetical protein
VETLNEHPFDDGRQHHVTPDPRRICRTRGHLRRRARFARGILSGLSQPLVHRPPRAGCLGATDRMLAQPEGAPPANSAPAAGVLTPLGRKFVRCLARQRTKFSEIGAFDSPRSKLRPA